MNFFKSMLLLIAALLSLNAVAREAVPIVNLDNVPVPNHSGKPLQAADVLKAIRIGSAVKGWTVSGEGSPLVATYVKQNKHTVVVEISYTAENLSMKYKDSSNMKYEVLDGVPVIHPSYNRWVNYLRDAIFAELHRL